MVDRFIVSAGSSYNVGSIGGSADATVVSHSHGVTSSGNLIISDPGHTHRLRGSLIDENSERSRGNIVDDDRQNFLTDEDYSNPGATQSLTGISISGSTQPAGNPATNANLPPYLGMRPIIKY